VPAHDGLGANEERTPALARQNPACCSQESAIRHPVDGPLKDRNLVTKHEILKADLLDGALPAGEHAEQPTKQHVEERGERRARPRFCHAWLARRQRCPGSWSGRARSSICTPRDGALACNLSEGEKTAIAFSYFLVKVKEVGFRKEEGIVVIDDPISSLDSNFVFHCFSLIKNNFSDAGQLFVLTHNFELFNLVKSWFCSKKKCNELCGFYMIKNGVEDGVRYADLCPLESTLLKFRSEYHTTCSRS
jgi:hypothetical protein